MSNIHQGRDRIEGISIHDVWGREVEQLDHLVNTWDVSTLSAGLYAIRIYLEDDFYDFNWFFSYFFVYMNPLICRPVSTIVFFEF